MTAERIAGKERLERCFQKDRKDILSHVARPSSFSPEYSFVRTNVETVISFVFCTTQPVKSTNYVSRPDDVVVADYCYRYDSTCIRFRRLSDKPLVMHSKETCTKILRL